MGGILRVLRYGLVIALLVLLAGVAWLVVSPPALIRIASAYTAKIVCSNAFIAGRDPARVLEVDVQAPGHPLLKYMWIHDDEASHRIDAGLFGLIGKASAVYGGKEGCTNIAPGETLVRDPARPSWPKTSDASALWPDGEAAQLANNPRLAAALSDPELQGPGMRAIVVVHDGRIVGETYGEGFDAKTPLLGWSMAKTVTAALLGLAIKDGKLSLDRKGLFPEWAGDGRADISLADLMAMASGLAFNEDYGDVSDVNRMLFLERDMAAFARSQPLVAKPGAVFSYSSGTSVLLSRIWQNAVGEQAVEYPSARLFKPLGMSSAVLERDETGTFVGSSYLYANAHDWARFGEFLALGGRWNGEELLPSGFVDYMRTPAPASDTGKGAEFGKGQVGVEVQARNGFELPDDTFLLRGHDGQTIAVIPSRRLVILRMGLTPAKLHYNAHKLLNAVVKSL